MLKLQTNSTAPEMEPQAPQCNSENSTAPATISADPQQIENGNTKMIHAVAVGPSGAPEDAQSKQENTEHASTPPKASPEKAKGGKFEKGKSGNPAGRPAVAATRPLS